MLTIKRFAAAYIDLAIASALLYAIVLSLFGPKWFDGSGIDHLLMHVSIGITIYIFKDIFGPSVGKRILKLKIVNVKDGSRASLWKRLIRNVFLIYPIIDIITMIVRKDHRKLLDVWLGINVIE